MADVIWADLRIETDKSKKDVAALNAEIAKTGKITDQVSRTGTAAYNQQAQATNKAANSQKKLQAETKNTQSGFTNMQTSLNGLAAALGITFATAKIVQFGKESIQAAVGFEKAVSELSSITGVMGQELEFYKQAAKDLSVANIEGVNVTSSAEDIVKAFSLVGSAKPELLASKEALAEVTKQAIILAEASGLQLPDAVKALTDVMNQFGAPAEQAGQYIDALAAGAKYGAAAIPQVAEAMVKFGAAAKSSNVSVVESTALIEVLGEKGLQGAEAGTALRNILIKLSNAPALGKEALTAFKQAGVDVKILSDSTLPLEVRLRETAKLMGTTGGLTHVFGAENQIAAQNILTNIDRYAQLNGQIKESGVAMEQARINTDNAAAKMKQFNNQISLLKINIGNELVPAMLDLISGLNALISKDFSAKGIDAIGTAFDRWTNILAYLPQPIGAIKTAFNSFKSALKDFQDGNILTGIGKYVEGLANVATLGLYNSVKKWFVPAKKEVVAGYEEMGIAGLKAKAKLEVLSMTDGELEAAMKSLAAQTGISEKKFSDLAETIRRNKVLEIFTELSRILNITEKDQKRLTELTDKYGNTVLTNSNLILKGREAYLKTLDTQASKEERMANQGVLEKSFQDYSKQLGVTKVDFNEYLKILAEIPEKTADAADGQDGLNNSTKKMAGPYEVLTNSVGNAMSKLQDLATLFKSGAVDWSDVTDQAKKYADQQNYLVEVNKKVDESLKRIPEATKITTTAMQTTSVTAIGFTGTLANITAQVGNLLEVSSLLGTQTIARLKFTAKDIHNIEEKAKNDSIETAQELVDRRNSLFQQLGINQVNIYTKNLAEIEKLQKEEIAASNGTMAAIATIVEKYSQAITVNQLKETATFASALSDIGTSLGTALGQIFGEAAKDSAVFAAFQKAISIATITFKSFEAIANGIASITAGGPLGIIQGIAQLTAGIGSLIGGLIQQAQSTEIPPPPSFWAGTGDTGPGGNIDSKGGFYSILHPHEGVVKRQANEKYPGLVSALNMGNENGYVMRKFAAPILREFYENKKNGLEKKAADLLLTKENSFDDFRLFRTAKEHIALTRESNMLLKKSIRKNSSRNLN